MQDLTLRVDHSGFSIYLQVRIYDQPKQTVTTFICVTTCTYLWYWQITTWYGIWLLFLTYVDINPRLTQNLAFIILFHLCIYDEHSKLSLLSAVWQTSMYPHYWPIASYMVW